MKKFTLIWVVVFIVMAGVTSGCGASGSLTTSSDDTSSTDDSADDTSDTTDDTDAAALSSGDTGIFVSISSSSSDTMSVGGQPVTIESGSSYIYRYVPDDSSVERLDNTYDLFNNYSCDSAGDQRPQTIGQRLLNIEVCPDIDDGFSTIDVEDVDPSTGSILSSSCSFGVAGTSPYSIDVTLIGDTLYYINTDGDLVTRDLSTCGTETLLPNADTDGELGSSDLFAVDGQLVSVLDDYANDRYVIKLRSSSTGALTDSLYILDYQDNESINFYEGDDALYVSIYNTTTYSYSIERAPLVGDSEEIYSTTFSDALIGASIDASGGKVLIVYKYVLTRDGQGYATSWQTEGRIYDVSSGTEEEVVIDDFFDTLMQIMVYE